jgi:hypothetical protein
LAAFHAARLARAARIDAQNCRHQRIEPLRLIRVARIRAATVAEAEVAAARIEQSVIGSPGPRRGVEADVTERMARIGHDMRYTQQLAARARERAGRGVSGMPLRDDVVIGHVRWAEPRRNEIRRGRIARGTLEVHGVKQTVARELGMEIETDEAALEPRVVRERKHGADIRINGRPIAIDAIEKAARVVGEAAAVRQLTNETHACPPGRRYVLVDGPQATRLGQPHHVRDLDHETVFVDGLRQWVRNLGVRATRAGQSQDPRHAKRR